MISAGFRPALTARGSRYKLFPSEKLVYDFGRVAVLAIDRVVQPLHLLIGDLSRQRIEDWGDLWMLPQGLLAHDWHRFIRRKIMAIVFQHKQIQRRNQPVGG